MGTLGDRIGRRRLLLIGAARVRRRLGARGVLDQRGDADRRRARCSASPAATLAPSTLSLIRNMFQRRRGSARSRSASGSPASPPARRSARCVGGLLLEHFWWGSVFLLARAGDGAAARGRARAAARVPRPRRRPPRPGERRHVAGRRARGDLRPQADRRGRLGRRRGGRLDRGRPGRRRALPASPAAPGRPADRPAPVPGPRLQRRARRRTARRSSSCSARVLHRPVPAAGARAFAAGGGAVDAALGRRLHRGLAARRRCSCAASRPGSCRRRPARSPSPAWR